MQRNDWKFTYTAAKLAEVADDKLRALSSAEQLVEVRFVVVSTSIFRRFADRLQQE